MNLFVTLLCLNVGIIFVCAQSDGRYRPVSGITKRPVVIGDGRYRAVSGTTKRPLVIGDGRYRPSNDGRYDPANDGRYRPNSDGKYTHIGDKDRGLYSGGGGEYTGEGGDYTGGGGQYTGGGGQYTGGGGQYTGGGGQYTGGGGQYAGISKNGSKNTGNTAYTGAFNTGGGGQYTESSNNGAKNTGNTAYTGGFNTGNGKTATPSPKTNSGFGGNLVTTAKPKTKPQQINGDGKNGWKILRDEKTEDTDGYHYLYETENGILAEESGRIENLAPNEDGLRSKGFYEYTGDDGVLYRVDYIADNNGFVPQGDHIPKTPPAIQKLLDYLAAQS